jgi:hypothetical protein
MSRACGIDLKHDRFSDRGNAEHASLPAHLSTVVAAPLGRDTVPISKLRARPKASPERSPSGRAYIGWLG